MAVIGRPFAHVWPTLRPVAAGWPDLPGWLAGDHRPPLFFADASEVALLFNAPPKAAGKYLRLSHADAYHSERTLRARAPDSVLRSAAFGSSSDRAVGYHLEERGPYFRWCVGLAVATTAEALQVPRPAMLKSLFEAVPRTRDFGGRCRSRLAGSDEEYRSLDLSLPAAYHAIHQSVGLKSLQPMLVDKGVQASVGVVDGNRGIHSFRAHVG